MKKTELTALLNELFDMENIHGELILDRAGWYKIAGELLDKYKELSRKKSPASNHNDYVAAWFEYFRRAHGITPYFGAVQASSLRQIRLYLEKQSDSPEQALDTWKAILSNYHKLEDFFKLNADLKFINSQLNKIIIQLKHVTGKATKGHNASDLRGQL